MLKNNKKANCLVQIKEFLANMFKNFNEDNCTFLAAGLSYYTTFAVPSMIIIIIMVGSIFVDSNEMKNEIIFQVDNLLGKDAEQQIKSIIKNVKRPDETNFFSISISIIALIFSATGAFQSINTVFHSV